MKKIFIVLFLALIASQAWAAVGDYIQVDNLKYKILTEATSSTAGTLSVYGLSDTGKAKTSLALNVPYVVSYNSKIYHVKEIVGSSFVNNSAITSLYLRYGIESIGSAAFNNCTNLATVHLPSTVTSVGASAFDYCSKLTIVYFCTMAGNVTCGSKAFPSNSSSILYCPKGADKAAIKKTTLGSFFSTVSLASSACDITLSNGAQLAVTKVPATGSRECAIIGYTKANDGLFKPSSNFTLTNYGMSFSIKSIATNAFYGNSELVEVDFSNLQNIDTIKGETFVACTNLTKATLSSPTINSLVFQNTPKLETIVYGYGVKTVGTVIKDCESLKTVEFSQTVDNISNCFFDNCPAVTQIKVASNSPYFYNYSKSGTSAMYKTEGKQLFKVVPTAETIEWDPSCLSIAHQAFANGNIKEILIPYGVKEIGYSAISKCSKLTTLLIPSSSTLISSNAFFQLSGLQNLYYNFEKPLMAQGSTGCWEAVNNKNLYLPYGAPSYYKGLYGSWWSEFDNYNSNGMVAYDYHEVAGANNNYYYTITSTEPCTINGKSYSGRAKLVKAKITGNAVASGDACTVPDYITINKNQYAVTCIGEEAFDISVQTVVAGCNNVDSVLYKAFDSERKLLRLALPNVSYIGEEAFDDCSSLASITWGSNLKYIGAYGLCNTAITSDIILPYGFKELYGYAFKGVKTKKIHIPSSTSIINKYAFVGMSSLTELILNRGYFETQTFDFSNVPTSCVVRVPVEWQAYAKVHNDWKRFTNIYPGAYDFCNGGPANATSTAYKMTVTSATPVTKDGVTYDGTAKYVYNEQVKKANAFYPSLCEIDEMLGGDKKYLITEIGDSCLNGSSVSTVSLTAAKYLERIGKKAFGGSAVYSITIPENCTKFGTEAFSNATSLNDLTILGTNNRSWDGQFVGNNASGFTMYISHQRVNGYLTSNLKNWVFSGTTNMVKDHVAPFINATTETFNLGQSMPLDFAASGLKAYIVTNYNEKTKMLTTQEVTQVPGNTGVIVTGLTVGKINKIKRATSAPTMPANLLYASPTASEDLYTLPYAYYYSRGNKKFVKPTSTYKSGIGYSYLWLKENPSTEYYLDLYPPTPSGIKGDVDGNGEVDITDANILINIVLGKDSASNYGGRADVTGEGDIDVSDINAVLNIILGK